MTRTFTAFGIESLRIAAGVRPSVATSGQDIRITWHTVAPFGGGFGESPYGLASYGGAEVESLRGAYVEIWAGRYGDGATPFVLLRSARPTDFDYVYRETDNRADAARYGLPFQARLKFVVRPWTTRGFGAPAELLTTSSALAADDGVVRRLDDWITLDDAMGAFEFWGG